MRDPFLRMTQRSIRKLGKFNKVIIVTELGEEREISAIFENPEASGSLRPSGTAKGGRDFKESAKKLRALTEEVEGINQEWQITVNGTEYFPADFDHDGDGSTLIYLALQRTLSGDVNGWR